MAVPVAAVAALGSKRGRKILGLLAVAVLATLALIAVLPAVAITMFLPTGQALTQQYCAAAASAVPVPQPTGTPSSGPIALDSDQFSNARTIVAAAQKATAEKKGWLAALTVAIARGDLRSDDAGPAATASTPLGVYRLASSAGWGTAAELRDVTTSTTRILSGFNGKPGILTDPKWSTQSPLQWFGVLGITVTAQQAQDASTRGAALLKQQDPTITDADLATGAACQFIPITGDAVAVAKALMPAITAGKLRNAGGSGVTEIANIANGTATADCGIDVRILQVVTIAVNTFDSVGISDINRKCTGQIEGAGTDSWHYKDGGGHAVDFSVLNGQPLTGDDAESRLLLTTLDPLMPAGSRAGQISCRPARLKLVNMTQFVDTPCNHQHIDVGEAKGGLLIGSALH